MYVSVFQECLSFLGGAACESISINLIEVQSHVLSVHETNISNGI